MTSPSEPRRAAVVGTGLIGGSIGLALRARGWWVTGRDAEPAAADRAKALGAVDAVGEDPDAEITFVATPLGVGGRRGDAHPGAERGARRAVVTDVAGVKAPLAAQLLHPGFVGGHPMAGSEQVGIDGADPDLFVGATWVLTPTASTDPGAYARLQAVVTSLGAEVLALSPEQHDTLVAMVSHVPAPHRGHAHEPRRPGRGGTRRPAAPGRGWLSGHDADRGGPARRSGPTCAPRTRPPSWPPSTRCWPTCRDMRDRVAAADKEGLLAELEHAATARRSLPARAVRPERLAELRVPVPDRPGVLAEITTLAGDLGVNIHDIELAHSVEGDRGVLVLVVDGDMAERLHDALTGRGYRSTSRHLE